jgi:Myb-like DNA-binding domain
MEALYATDNQILLGTTCRMQAAKQHVHTVPDPVSTASETFSRVAHRSVSRRLMSPSLSLQPTQNGPWTTEEDEILSAYRTQGYGWAQIQEKHFPGKSANACRKRHERLMTKRRSAAWDESRLESLAVNYRGMREHIWRCLADRLGEKWEHVEKIVRGCAINVFSLSGN